MVSYNIALREAIFVGALDCGPSGPHTALYADPKGICHSTAYILPKSHVPSAEHLKSHLLAAACNTGRYSNCRRSMAASIRHKRQPVLIEDRSRC